MMCEHEFVFDEIIDKAIAGDIVSTAFFKCRKCGKEFTEKEVIDYERKNYGISEIA